SFLLLEKLVAMRELLVDFAQRLFEIATLVFHRGAMPFQQFDVMLQLRIRVVWRRVVYIDEIKNLRQLETHALAPQCQFQASPVTWVIDAVPAFAGRADDTLVFIEADGSWRDAEFARKLGNSPGLLDGFAWFCSGFPLRAMFGSCLAH